MWTDIDKTNVTGIKGFAEVMRMMGNWHKVSVVNAMVVRKIQKFMRKTNPTHLRGYKKGNIEMYMMWKYADEVDTWNLYAWCGVNTTAPATAKIFAKELVRFLKSKGVDRCYATVPTFTNADAKKSWAEFDKLMDVIRTPMGKSTHWLMRLDKIRPTARVI